MIKKGVSSSFRNIVIAIIMLAVLFLSFQGAKANPPTSVKTNPGVSLWSYKQIDQPKKFSILNERCLKFDSNGRPHITYGGNNLFYAWFDGSAWKYEIVDVSDNSGAAASLLFGQNDLVQIGYVTSVSNTAPGSIKYAYKDTSGWHIQVADTSPNYPFTGLSFATDNYGFPHFSVFRGPTLLHVYKDAGGWHNQEIASYYDAGYDKTSLAIDENGVVSIIVSTYSGLSYVKQTGVSWDISKPIEDGGFTHSPSLILDKDSYAHLSYVRNDQLFHTYQDSQGWHTETIEDDAVINDTSITFDSQDKLHVVFTYQYLKAIKHAYWDGSVWQVEIIEDAIGEYNSISTSSIGEIGVGYLTQGSLKYAHKNVGIWNVETVDHVRAFQGAVFEIDQMGYSKVAYLSFNDYSWDLMYASETQTGWVIEALDHSSDVRTNPSFVLDELGYPHISYMNNGLIYLYQDGSGWHKQLVDPDCAGSSLSYLALDQNRFPHISYFTYSSHQTKYAYQNETGWHVDSDLGNYLKWDDEVTSLILLPNGSPGISYSGNVDAQVFNFAYRDAGGWHTEDIDSTGSSFLTETNNNGTVIRPNGNIVSLYGINAGTAGTLKLANKDLNGWHNQSLGSFSSSRESVYVNTRDLIVDSSGYPYILYDISFTRSPTQWYFAHQLPGGVWDTRRLDLSCSQIASDKNVEIHMVCIQAKGALVLANSDEIPITGLSATNTNPKTSGAATTFTARVTAGNNISYTWDFGDHITDTGEVVTHAYYWPGIYTATVTAYNSVSGVTASTKVTVLRNLYLPFVRRQY